MKAALPITFLLGAACGAGVYSLFDKPAPEKTGGVVAAAVKAAEGRAAVKPVKAVKVGGPVAQNGAVVVAGAEGAVPAEMGEFKVPDPGEMDKMMKKDAERKANRDADRLALRLKLTGSQKEALRAFLVADREWKMAKMQETMSGKTPATAEQRQTLEEFLKGMLEPTQLAEHEKAQAEDKAAKAEDFAQRRIRALDRELGLNAEQKDRVFQALANARLTEPQKSDLAAHLEAAGAPAEAIATMATIDADGGVFGVEMEDMPFLGNLAGAKERETLAGILTEEQMAVYDQRREDDKASNPFFGGAAFSVETVEGAAASDAVEAPAAAPVEAPAGGK
jgi:hypothetical protein